MRFSLSSAALYVFFTLKASAVLAQPDVAARGIVNPSRSLVTPAAVLPFAQREEPARRRRDTPALRRPTSPARWKRAVSSRSEDRGISEASR
ncbi:hypothetical protein C8R46DRAFT_1215482 [Mycena filopes]|nr:hypothetical protein C8R46DRAFT_1215482 [Mycena filopes]